MRLIFNELGRLPHVNMIQCKAFGIAEQRVLHALRVYTIPPRNYLPWPFFADIKILKKILVILRAPEY